MGINGKILEKMTICFYYLSVLCFILPSGSIFSIPVKLIISSSLILVLVASRFISNKAVIIDEVILGILIVVVLLMIWSCIGVYNEYETVFTCLKSFLSLLITVSSTYIVVKNQIVSIKQSITVFIWVAVGIVVVKLFCEFILMTGILDWDRFINLYKLITNTSITTMQIPLGGVIVYRLMASNDYLPLVLMGFYLLFEKTSIIKKILIVALLGLYTFVVYSRVAMLQYGFIIVFWLMSMMWDFLKNTTRKRMAVLIVLLVAFFVCVTFLMIFKPDMIINHLDAFYNSMYERWLGNSAVYSDSFRSEQIIRLWNGVLKSPVFGQGLGAYIRGYLRSTVLPFSYEAEYLSFLYQFGLIGFVLIICGIVLIFAKICFSSVNGNRMKLLVLLNFSIWAVRPLYNPQFLSSSSGMIIVVIFIAASFYSKYGYKKL